MKKNGPGKKKEGRLNILERASEMFDLPGEVVAGVTRVTITGGGRVYVENHRGIIDYSDTDIVLSGGRTVIRISGRGLQLRSMSTSELLITGSVLNVAYEY